MSRHARPLVVAVGLMLCVAASAAQEFTKKEVAQVDQKMIAISGYSRTAETPQGLSLDQPFELPAKIREVQIQRGAATIIQ